MTVVKIETVDGGALDTQYAVKAVIVGADGEPIDIAGLVSRVDALEGGD